MSKIEIPDGVVDKKAYIKFVTLSRNPLLRNHYYEASDGQVINLHIAPQYINKYIAHLPPAEQEEIVAKKKQWISINTKMFRAKRLAFGHKHPGRPKLDSVERDIVALFGRMYTVPEVIRIMGEDNEVVVTEEYVRQVLKRRIVDIERKREEFRNKVADVRLYNKRPRLEELAWMYSKMKMRYVAKNGIDAYNAMLRTLEQLRKEAEGDQININGALDVNINVEIQEHIQKEILKTINLKEIIIGRICARMGYDTKKLINSLHNSYYHKFTVISGDYNPDAEMEYPSLVNYDYAEIERKNNEIEDAVILDAEPVEEKEKEKADLIREMFLSKIRAQRKEAEARTSAYTEEHGSEYEELGDEDDLGMAHRNKVGGRIGIK